MLTAVVVLVVLLAGLTQSLVGFGSAMVLMVALGPLLGLATAAPMVALTALTVEVVVLARYRETLRPADVWRLVAGAPVGVPLGVAAVRRVPEAGLLPALGAVIAGYALYALLARRLPELRAPGWAFAAGALAGLLGGAYNTSGPPVIVYADCQRWPLAEFKGNLQGFFVVSDCLVVLGHALAGNLTRAVWGHYALALPAMALGAWAGVKLADRLAPPAFRRLALVALLLGRRLALAVG